MSLSGLSALGLLGDAVDRIQHRRAGAPRTADSWTGVQPSPRFGEAFNSVSTRLAYSDDEGESWTDVGVVNAAGDQPLPWPHDKLYARWEQEVSRILFDPWSPAGSRWKLLWHRYLRVYDGKGADSVPLFEHGWIELRTAADPGGEWSPGRKLFVGRGYDRSNDRTFGPPEIRLHEVASGKDQLGRYVAFTEPGLVARSAPPPPSRWWVRPPAFVGRRFTDLSVGGGRRGGPAHPGERGRGVATGPREARGSRHAGSSGQGRSHDACV